MASRLINTMSPPHPTAPYQAATKPGAFPRARLHGHRVGASITAKPARQPHLLGMISQYKLGHARSSWKWGHSLMLAPQGPAAKAHPLATEAPGRHVSR